MARRCELTGKRRLVGNHVSHANNKTKRCFLPNLVNVSFLSDILKKSFQLRVTPYALRSVEHRGGFDAFLQKTEVEILSSRVRLIRRRILACTKSTLLSKDQ